MYHNSIKFTYSNFEIKRNEDSPYSAINFIENEWEFDYIFHSKKENDTLLVLLPSALNKNNRRIPNFSRWGWSSDFSDFDTLSSSDPTLRINEKMFGGWYQGLSNDWLIPRLANHIANLQENFKYKNIIFCGSSLGGFVALQMTALGESLGIKCDNLFAYAENPQISLFNYQHKTPMKILSSTSYGVGDLVNIPEEFHYRLNVIELLKKYNSLPKGLIAIKESDAHHLNDHVNHLENYYQSMGSKNLIFKKLPSELDNTGHTAFHKIDMFKHIQEILLNLK